MKFKDMKNMKIRTQLVLTTLIFTLLVTVLGFYLFYNINKILSTKASDSAEILMNNVEKEITYYFDNIQYSANTIIYLNQIQEFINNKTEFQSYDLYKNINTTISNITLTNTSITSVFLEIKDIRLSFNDVAIDIKETDNITLSKSETYFTKLLPTTDGNSTTRYFAVVRPIYNIRNFVSSIPSGKLTLVLDKTFFDNITSRYGITQNSNIYIISNNSEIISKNTLLEGTSPSDDSILSLITNTNESSTVFIDNIKYIYHNRSIDQTGWKIVSLIPSKEYLYELNNITKVTFILFALAIMVMLSISVTQISNITLPIQQLLSSMDRVSKGQLKERSSIQLDNEIGKLSSYFNNMMEEVNFLTNRIFENQQKLYEFELANKDARLIALHSQINPHFLYNTLGCIQSIAIHYNVDEISEVAKALARIFRYSIKENDYVIVSAEVENLRNYMMIEQIKSLDKIKFDIDISSDIMNETIIKLILQPIVENAVIHGLTYKSDDCRLSVKGYRYDKYLEFIIEDNGIGMSPEKVAELNSRYENTNNNLNSDEKYRSIGIMNVKQRLSLCYNNDYVFNIQSTLDKGTTVYMRIPCMEGRYNENDKLVNSR